MLAQIKEFLETDTPAEALDPLGIVLRSLRGRERRVAAIVICVALLAAICAYLFVKPIYQSAGVVRVLAREQKILYADADDSRLRLYDAFVSAEMQLIQSRPVLDSALSDLHAPRSGLRHAPEDVGDLAAMIEVSNKKGLVTVAGRSGDPELSAAAVNAVLSSYEAGNEAARGRQYDVRRTELSARESELEALLEQLNFRYLEIGGEHDVSTLAKAHVAKTAQLEVLEQRIDELGNTILQLQATGGVGADVGNVEIQRATLLDKATADMTYERAKRLASLETLRRRYRSSHPKLRSAELELLSLESAITERREQITTLGKAGALTGGSGGSTQQSLDELETVMQKLVARRQAVREEASELNSKRIRIRSVVTEQDRVSELLEETKRALDVVQVESHNDLSRSVVVVSRGKIPDGAIDDKRKPAALGAAVFGGLGTFASFVLGTLLMSRVRFSDDLDQSATKLLASVAEEEPCAQAPLLTAAHELRNEFDLRMPANIDRPLVIGVVASTTGSGATSMAEALARTYADKSREVLLIDADLREHGLTQLHKLDQAPGVLEVVSAVTSLSRAAEALPAEGANLHLLPAGAVERVSTSAGYLSELTVDDMQDLLNLARDEYNVVVVDLGELSSGRQSAVGAALVDRVVMVGARDESKRKLATALHLLERLAPEKTLLFFNRAHQWDPALAVNTFAAVNSDPKQYAGAWLGKVFRNKTENS
jgi:Mrp family chromosome partitioning ATPase